MNHGMYELRMTEYLNAKNSTLYDIEALTLHVEWKKKWKIKV